MTNVITWQSPRGAKLNLTPEQETMLTDAGIWLRDGQGMEYCQVYYGLHGGHPTYTDEEIRVIIIGLPKTGSR